MWIGRFVKRALSKFASIDSKIVVAKVPKSRYGIHCVCVSPVVVVRVLDGLSLLRKPGP
jgi:hypothetical protein